MIAPRVPTEGEIQGRLLELGFTKTARSTDTGTFWKHGKTGQHLLVPDSLEGLYPDWLFDKVLLAAEEISGQRIELWPGWLPRPDIHTSNGSLS